MKVQVVRGSKQQIAEAVAGMPGEVREAVVFVNEVSAMYDFSCEHCDGTVRERQVDREALRYKGTFVILEQVPVGVCDKCGARYFDASVLRRVAQIGRGATPAQRTMEIPVDRYAPA